jgi:hypothetical protein
LIAAIQAALYHIVPVVAISLAGAALISALPNAQKEHLF